MGKADTHRDAHLRLFIPRSTYNTPITGNIPERLARRRRFGWRKRKRDAREGSGGSRSPEDAAKRAWLEILRTVVVPPLNVLLFPPLSSDILLSTLFSFSRVFPALFPMHLHR